MQPYSQHYHGITFENIVKATYSNYKSKSIWDIEFEDKQLPISIKSKKMYSTMNIEMADARRLFSINNDFRLIVGFYNQIKDKKVIVEITEYLITNNTLQKLKGDLDYTNISEFHDAICNFKKGEHLEARNFANEYVTIIKNDLITSINLHPKIDLYSQRRLQCSISKKVLDEKFEKAVYRNRFKELSLPIVIEKSPPRTFASLTYKK